MTLYYPRIKRLLALLAGALFALTGCNNVKIQPSEDFFYGPQLRLAQAIQRGNLDDVKALIPLTDLNKPGAQGMTLLFFTLQCAFGEKPVPLHIVTLLVKAGADPLHKAPNLGSALGVSLRAKSPLYVQAFLDGGVSPNMVKGSTPIIFDAARDYTFDTLKLLVARGADVNKRDSLGNTVINEALAGYQLDQVEWLLDHGADPTVVDNHGNSFAAKIQNRITSEQDGSRTQQKLFEIRDQSVRLGMKWPPDSREVEQARMRARGQMPGKSPDVK